MLKSNYLLFFFVLIVTFSFAQSVKECTFSHSPGFYKSDFYLKISCDKGDLFYFDENNIDKDRKSFPDSLLIDKTNTISLLVSHADSVHKLGSFSYFIGFNTNFKVVSISINNDFLFDTYKGIYVKGPRAYFDTVSNHYRNVNWERKWERENFVEVFNEKGVRIISQESGMKIFGGMTKYLPEKSLRLIARKKYGKNRFEADLFNTGDKKYKQFVLRHSGGDYRSLRFRDAFMTSLASESELDVQESSPAHVFINSEYWGIYNIREKINEYFIDNHYSCGTTGVDILRKYNEVEEGTVDDYNKLLKFVQNNNLKINSNYIEVQKMIDARNLINFWVHQMFYANIDVRGNIRFWKSDSLDGKFRWIVYDTDLGFLLNLVESDLLKDFTSKYMTDWYNPRWSTFLLRNLLKNEDFKRDFIHQSSYLLSSTLSTDYLLERINEFKQLYDDEMRIHFKNRKKFQNYQGNYKRWEESITEIQTFAEKRDDFSFLHLQRKFNLNKPYYIDLRIENYNHGTVILNNNELKSESFFGSFYSEFELPISIEADIGYSYIGYLKNTITGRSGDTLNLDIKFVERKPSETDVIINEINYVDDCFEIYNREDNDVDLSGWIILDKNNNNYNVNNLFLKEGSFAIFHYSDSVNKIDSVEYRKIGFRLSSSDEEISLYDNENHLVDRISYKLTETQKSYSRNIPFEEFDGTKVEWRNIEQSTIGFHNQTYTNLLEGIKLRELKARKSRRIVIASLGGAILIPFLFFLINWRRKKISTSKS